MKKYLYCLLVGLLGFNFSALAQQITVTLGTYSGAASTNALLSTSTTTNRYSRTISLYTAEEIINGGGTAGDITSLAWDKYGSGEYTFGDAYIRICMKHVNNSVWLFVPDWNDEVANATEVFTSSTFSIPTGTGWKEVPFNLPFTWNGTDNIAIFVEWYRPSTLSSDMSWGYATTTNANATRVGSTSLEALELLVNSNRPLVQLNFNGINWDPVNSLTVQTQGNVPPIVNVDDGTLQMEAIVLPNTANQNVSWSIIPETGNATISSSGLLTALNDGTVWAKAVSIQDPNYKDSMLVTISNQVIPIESIVVSTQGNVPAEITTNGGNLQMEATIVPAESNQEVIWTIVPGTGNALINSSGWVTALADGTVWAKAVAVQDPSFSDSLEITISNQNPNVVDSVVISTTGGAQASISEPGGTLSLQATVYPLSADQSVVWSIVQVDNGDATIASNGIVTAVANGIVFAKAVSVADPARQDSLMITIIGQETGIDDIISGAALQLYPNPAKDQIILAVPEAVFQAGATVQIIDFNGKVLRTMHQEQSQQQYEISDLPTGNYQILYQQGTERASMKFTVLK